MSDPTITSKSNTVPQEASPSGSSSLTSAELASSDSKKAGDTDDSSRRAYAMEKIVRFWGEMASNWGINRTMAQIYVLLYLDGAPLHTDDIMQQLDISRGNANMNLRSLVEWDIVRKMRKPESRKDFYVAEKDLWDATAQIIRERERREIRPVKEQLQSCAGHLVRDSESLEERPQEDQQMYRRLQDLIELMEVLESFSSALLPHVRRQNVPAIKQMMKLAVAMANSEEGS
jgi:HTH-type transcriptional regulator, glycine betaine synthesis regulator